MAENLSYKVMDDQLEQLQEAKNVDKKPKQDLSFNRGLKDIIHLFIVNKVIAITIFLTIVISTAIQQFLITPWYRSTMLLELVKSDSMDKIEGFQYARSYNYDEVKIGNILTLMQSGYILSKVHERISSIKNDTFDMKNYSPKINLFPIPSTDLLRLSISDTQPDRAKIIAETLIEIYSEESEKKASQSNKKSLEIISTRINQGKIKSQELENKIIEFNKNNPSISFKAAINGTGLTSSKALSIVEIISKKEVEYLTIVNDSKNLRSFIDRNDILAAVNAGFSTPKIQKFLEEHIKIDSEKIALLEKFKNKHPKIIELNSSMKSIKEAIKKELIQLISVMDKKATSLTNDLKSLKNELDPLKKEILNENSKEFEKVKLERELELNKQINLQLIKRERELELSNTSNTQDFFVIEPPQVPTESYYPNRGKNIILSIFVSFVIVFILVVLLDFISPKVLTASDIERSTESPLLKSLSNMKFDKNLTHSRELMVCKDLDGYGAEAFRHLRSKIEYRMKKGSKTLLISSANKDDGKTFTSINIAIAFSMKKKKVLLVDADLRKATLSKVFKDINSTNRVGLSHILTKNVHYSEAIVRTMINGLNIIFAGEKVAYPTEVLDRENFYHKFIEEAEKNFDLIIIDSPKAYLLSDPLVLATSVENIIIVASYGSPMSHVQTTSNALEEVGGKIIGSILNKVPIKFGENSSYYYY